MRQQAVHKKKNGSSPDIAKTYNEFKRFDVLVAGQISIAFSQGQPGGNATAGNSNASSLEANIAGAANANNTNQSAPTAANTTAANASQSNASLYS
jgi:hypothetical protein